MKETFFGKIAESVRTARDNAKKTIARRMYELSKYIDPTVLNKEKRVLDIKNPTESMLIHLNILAEDPSQKVILAEVYMQWIKSSPEFHYDEIVLQYAKKLLSCRKDPISANEVLTMAQNETEILGQLQTFIRDISENLHTLITQQEGTFKATSNVSENIQILTSIFRDSLEYVIFGDDD